jgi:hypothetical protein
MAFNPFNVFRRNQKAIFAVLTVFIMFMFTLSFGQGDFFQMLPKWLGSKRATGEVLAVIDGSKVYQSETEQINRQRNLANQYMIEAGQKASVNLAKYVQDGAARVSAENRTAVQEFLRAREFNYLDINTFIALQQGQATPDQLLRGREQTIGKVKEDLDLIVKAKDPKPNDLDVAQVALTLLDLDLRLTGQGASRQAPHYFANQPNANNRDLVNFVLWQKKADELGIHLTTEDVNELVAVEFSRKVSEDELRSIRDGLKNRVQGYNQDQLTEALTEEFRVRTAQTAVIGPAYVRPANRAFDAPYDYFRFFREQTAPARFGVISVPVANYLDRVQGAPTSNELRELFNKGRSQEPNPAEARPGFKEPRKIKVEWIEVTGKEPYYQAAAAEGLPKSEALAMLAFFLAAGTSESALLAAPAPAATPDLTLQARYQNYLRTHQDRVRNNWFSSPIFEASRPLDGSVVRLPNVVDLVGSLAGAFAAAGSPLGPVAEFVGHAYAADRKARLDSLHPAVIPPAGPGVMGLGQPFALAAVVGGSAPPLPLAAVRGMLTDAAKEEFARTVARADLTKFQDELVKLNVKTEVAKDEARRKVEEFVKSRGLTAQHGQSADFRDIYTLADDQGLKPLKDRFDALIRQSGQLIPPDARMFGTLFFSEFDPATNQMAPATGFYKPSPFPPTQFGIGGVLRDNESTFLVWRTADQEAKAPRTLEEEGVRAKVEAAWRENKARELARKDAEELAKKTQNLGANFLTVEPKLRDLQAEFSAQFPSPQAKGRVKYFSLDNVAPLIAPKANPLDFMRQPSVTEYQVPRTEEIPYPGPKMAEELLKVRDQPPSTPVVLVDAPEDTFYVAVLLDRTEPLVYDFAAKVWGPTAQLGNPNSGGMGPAVSLRHQAELRKQMYDRALAALKAEFHYEKEHELVNKKSDETGE